MSREPEGREWAPRARAAATIAGVVACVVVFAWGSWSQRWVSDDGMINVRIAQNLLDGHGLVYNVGERVEAGTSPLWVWMIAASGALGVRIETASVWLAWMASIFGLVAVAWAGLRARGVTAREAFSGESVWAPIGLATFAVVPGVWDYATAGLETGLALGWCGAVYAGFARWVDASAGDEPGGARWWWATMLVASLGPLVRPELSLLSILVGVASFAGGARTFGPGRWGSTAAKAVVALGTIPVAYQIVRMGYFGILTPNTALAKEAFGSRWQQGMHFVRNFFGLYQLYVPALFAVACAVAGALVARADRWRALVYALPMAVGLFYVFYVIKVGGGFMHARMFVVPLFLVCAPASLVRLDVRKGHVWRWIGAACLLAWAVWCATTPRVGKANEHGIGDERGWYARMAGVEHPILVEDYARHRFTTNTAKVHARIMERCAKGGELPGACDGAPVLLVDYPRQHGRVRGYSGEVAASAASVAPSSVWIMMRGAIGIIGVVQGHRVHIVDKYGLSDPIAARLVLGKRGRPGHEKQMKNVWLVARYTEPGPKDDSRLRAAREVLECEPVREVLDAVTAPMTWSRFWTNVVSAPRLHRVRIHPDPLKARKELCGSQQ